MEHLATASHPPGFTPQGRCVRLVLAAAWAALGVLSLMLLLIGPGADAKQKFMSGFGEA